MKFGPVPLSQAEGTMLVHGQTVGDRRFRKGRILDAGDIAHLTTSGIKEITVAIFEPGDIDENSAALRLAEAAAGPGVRAGVAGTGRVNLFARHGGLAMLDADAIDQINRIDEGITISTLRPLDRVDTEQVVATIKIIPFAVSETSLHAAKKAANHAVTVRAYRPYKIGLLQTNLPGLPRRFWQRPRPSSGPALNHWGVKLPRRSPSITTTSRSKRRSRASWGWAAN